MKKLMIGDKVKFNEKVYSDPYTPFYDEYKDHEFVVIALHYNDSHVELSCTSDSNLAVVGYVHADELFIL